MNRRQALSLLAALPLAMRVSAQTRSTAKHRVALGRWGLLIEPGGTMKSWSADIGAGDTHPAEEVLGLGHNRPVNLFTLYQIPNLTGVVTAAVGSAAAYAVLANGQVLSWGAGGYGVLGTTPLDEFETPSAASHALEHPQPVAVKFDAVDVSSKGEHVLALARDGGVYAWGRGDAGQLGIGPMPVINYKGRSASRENFMPLPVRIPGLSDVVAISTGDMHSLALLKDGTVRAWGQNRFGQVGDGTTIESRYANSRTGSAKRRRHRRARLLLSGGLVRRYRHAVGQHPREQRSSTCTGGGRRRARPSLGRRRRRSCGGAHANRRGHDLGLVRSLRDRPRPGRERTGARQGAHRRRVCRYLPVGQRCGPGVGPHHDVVRGTAVAPAGQQRTPIISVRSRSCCGSMDWSSLKSFTLSVCPE